jgi:hypothetical protein
MRTSSPLGARAYLKSIGFVFDKKPHQLDRLLLKSLRPSDQEHLQAIWASMHAGLSNGLAMYLVPKTTKQATLLFSHDWPRIAATLEWFDRAVEYLSPSVVVEMGCGAGFLLRYLSSRHPSLNFQGIDAAANLIGIAKDLMGKDLIVGDYLATKPDRAYDLVVCDFGFDAANLNPSQTPHSTAVCGGLQYCPGCSDDLKLQFEEYMKAWRRWGNAQAHLAIAGRITDFGMLRAIILSANDVGWVPLMDASKILRVRNLADEPEKFPALIFAPDSRSNTVLELDRIARFYAGT